MVYIILRSLSLEYATRICSPISKKIRKKNMPNSRKNKLASFFQSLRYLQTSIISLISLKSTTFSMTLFYIFINSYVKKKNYPIFFSSGMVKELHVCFPMFTWLAIDIFKLKINVHSFRHTNKQIFSQQIIKIKIDIEIDISNRTLRHRELY